MAPLAAWPLMRPRLGIPSSSGCSSFCPARAPSPPQAGGLPVFVSTAAGAGCLVSNQAPVGAVAYHTPGLTFEALPPIVPQRGCGQRTAPPDVAWDPENRPGADFQSPEPRSVGLCCCCHWFFERGEDREKQWEWCLEFPFGVWGNRHLSL